MEVAGLIISALIGDLLAFGSTYKKEKEKEK